MRRSILYSLLAVVALVVGGVLYWSSHRTLVLERTTMENTELPPGMTRRPPQKHQNLVGTKASAFTAVDRNGQLVSLEGLRGRVVVLNVWATWCQPCREELPRIEREIWQKYRPDIAVVAIARQEGASKVNEFNQKANLTFTLVPDPDNEITPRYGGDDGIPRTYVIDRSGTIVYQALGYGEKPFAEVLAAVAAAVATK